MKIDLNKLKELKPSFRKEDIEALDLDFEYLLNKKIIVYAGNTEFGYENEKELTNSIKNKFYILSDLGENLINNNK